MTHCSNCHRLEETIADLRYQIAELRNDPSSGDLQALKSALGLSMGEAHLLMALYAAGSKVVTNTRLFALRLASTKINDDADMQVIKVNMSKIRKKIGADAIETVWGVGYRITPVGKSLINQALGMES